MDMEEDFAEEKEYEESVEEEECPPPGSDAEGITYWHISREYKTVLDAMEKNEEARQFAEAYVKMYEALTTTHNLKDEFVVRVNEMQDSIDTNTNEISQLKENANKDATKIGQLKVEIERAWNLADAAHAREQAAQEAIENLRLQVMRLSSELKAKSRTDSDGEDPQVAKQKEGLQRELDRIMAEVDQLKQRLVNALSYQEDLERKNSLADMKINEMCNVIEDQKTEATKQQKEKEELEEDINELKNDIDKLKLEIDDLKMQITINLKHINRTENQLKDQKAANDKLAKHSDSIASKLYILQEQHDILNIHCDKLGEELTTANQNLKNKSDENFKLKSELFKMSKIRESYEKKLKAIETKLYNCEQERNKLRNIISIMEKEVDLSKKQAELDKRTIESNLREKEIFTKNLKKAEALLTDNMKLMKIMEQARRKLESDNDKYMTEIGKQRKNIAGLEKEKDRLNSEIIELNKNIKETMEEVKLKQMEIVDHKKTIAETEARLKQQMNMFEAVRAERNSFQKQLQESQAENNELKGKLKVSSHQSEQLKEDITSKEEQLLKQDNQLRKMNKEKENLVVEVQNGLEIIAKYKNEVAQLTQEETRLNKVIQEEDDLIKKQAKDLEQIMNERDIIGTQLVRRNDELVLLYEKINILQLTLHKGEAQYEQRLDDIRLLKIEIKRLRQEKNLLTRSIKNMTDLRTEVFQLERELTAEKLKSKALEEELQNPLNVHRWRKLEGSDPGTLDLLQKIRLLQKRLLTQCSEAIEREKQLKEAEILYLNLRQVLAKQPGPEVQEQLIKTQKALSQKVDQLKSLVSELNMCESKLSEYKLDLERVNKELTDIKKKYYNLKKHEQLSKERERQYIQECLPKIDSHVNTKIAGGGFKFAPT